MSASLEDLGIDDPEEFNRQQKAKFDSALEEHTAPDEEHEAAIKALRDPEEDDTAEVELGQTTLTVKTYLEEPIRKELRRLDRRRDEEEAQRSILPRVMAWLVEAPEEYASEELWQAYGEKYGFDELALVWFKSMLPKVERIESHEAVRRFRDITEGRADTRDE